MNFALTKQTAKTFIFKSLSVLLVLAIVASMALVSSAAVVIKTQDAADKHFENGALKGIDVSKWQGNISWNKVAQDNVKFAFIRATYGAENDSYFVSNAQSAHEHGVKVGAYHYARFKSKATVEAEAEAFIKQLKKVKISYPVVLDIENNFKLTKKQLTSLALYFMELVEDAGYSVMVYSYQNFYDKCLNINSFDENQIWVANYIEHPSTIPHCVWQHTSYGSVDGISGRVDINVAYNDLTVKKYIEVDGAISKNVITYINNRTGSEMDTSKIDMTNINYWVSTGIQRDLMSFYDDTVEVSGVLNAHDVSVMIQLGGNDPENADIIGLIQAKLFYTGNYTQDITRIFDAHTTEAIKKYQSTKGLEPNGRLNERTLNTLFNIQ